MPDDGVYKTYEQALAEAGWAKPVYEGADLAYSGAADDQYLRKWELRLSAGGLAMGAQGTVISTNTPGIDFRMEFKIRHADIETPGTAEITIYNLSNTTANRIIKEYAAVVLQAGYIHGHYGVIFKGTIKQYKKGRLNATDSYLTIYAADGDPDMNLTYIAKSYEKGGNYEGTVQEGIKKSFEEMKTAIGHMDPATVSGTIGGVAPKFLRGPTLWGLSIDVAKSYERTLGRVWSIQNGVLQVVGRTNYHPGEVVVINSDTGMIGVPEVTQDGIHVQCLLNPMMYVKQQIRIDNKSLNQMFAPGTDATKAGAQQTTYGAYAAQTQYWASTSEDGTYCIIVLDHEGDTRGQAWYSYINCLNVDPTNSTGTVPGGSGYVNMSDLSGTGGDEGKYDASGDY